MIGSSLPLLPHGLRQAPDGGPPLREDEAVPMPVEISFGDFLANLNPLHHIPVVGWAYRQITGESVNPAFRALGGFLLGGPVGAIIAAVGAMAESLFSDSPDGGAGGAVAVAPPLPAGAATAAALPRAAGTQLADAVPLADAAVAPVDGQALAARLGARSYRAPSEAALPALAASRPAGESGFAERMMRGLDAYDRTLRLRRDGT
ncbi:hypothetical protein [Elioraea tepidiphila]|uniref:hypothetical protein n=1 Tax=Elioraea tepidiphila TaxID=457934 RepID=UPI00035DA43E|nr:hypothetical protein [Elioraea tepidiphila]